MKKILTANIYCFGSQKRTFCYKIDAENKDIIGSIVKVDFSRRELFGVVLSIKNIDVIDGQIMIGNDNFSVEKLKGIKNIVYKNIISKEFLEFLQKMSWYNIIHLERLFENVIPSFWLNKKREIKQINEDDKYKDKENIKKNDNNDGKKIILTEEQQKIADEIYTTDFKVSLLRGVMGSGKTYIFLENVKKILNEKQTSQVLIMVPEIALTSNLIKVIYDFCGIKPIIWHSSISISKKKVYFESIIKGISRIVISTRSGLLLPYKNLSLIVIDEEHDNSYKQDEIPCYNARDMAILRAKYENIPVILSSATPSIETLKNVMDKKYALYTINTQFFHSEFPKVELIENDYTKNSINRFNNIFSKSRESIIKTLQKGEQSMVFINRRGYSRTLKCDECGFEAKCENCDNFLSYHKNKNCLKCHYCGYTINNISICKNCGSKKLSPNKGVGVEQVEKEIKEFCQSIKSDLKTLLFSSDEITKEGDIEAISNEIKNGDIDIIIGTQIMTKGHHFPRLTNIVVLDIDGMSLDCDFRAYEKMFQMLFQLSGRAGREKSGATIYIQTSNKNNQVLQSIQKCDIRGFYKSEISQRKKFNLPPFSRYISIIISSTNQKNAYEVSLKIQGKLKELLPKNTELLGPSESNLYYLKKNYRYRFLIKSSKKQDVLNALNNFYNNFLIPSGIQLKIDVDPYNFV